MPDGAADPDTMSASAGPETPGVELRGFDEPVDARAFLRWKRNAGEAVADGRIPPFAVLWRSRPALIVTRQETRLPGFDAAAAASDADGWPVVVRDSGGGAFPIGPETVQIALVLPNRPPGLSLDAVYRRLAAPILAGLGDMGIAASVEPVAGAFCPGRHDIAVGGRKLGGLAQRWRGGTGPRGHAMAEASLLVDGDAEAMTDVVNGFHRRAMSDFRARPDAVTTVAQALAGSPARRNGFIHDVAGVLAARFGETGGPSRDIP